MPSASQPSFISSFPSSHYSLPDIDPSLLFATHKLGSFVSQVQNSSTKHVEEHPSPLIILPSSQTSIPLMRVSPQVSKQTEGFGWQL